MASVGFQGYIPSTNDPRDHEVSVDDLKELSTGPYSSAFDIYKDKSPFAEKLPFTPHIYAQGDIASCVCNAFASAYACALQRQGHDSSFKPSRLFLYYLARLAEKRDPQATPGKSDWFASMASNPPTDEMLTDQGSVDRDVLKAISALGCCAEAESLSILRHESNGTWPYIDLRPKENVQGDMPPYMPILNATAQGDPAIFPEGALGRIAPDVKCFANATRHRTLRYAHPQPWNDVNCWKALIQAGYPVVFAINIYTNFYETASSSEGEYIAQMPNFSQGDQYNTGHVVMAVGWDDKKGKNGCFRVQNSWGDKWADGGFYWMEYSWLSSDCLQTGEAWVLIDSEDK